MANNMATIVITVDHVYLPLEAAIQVTLGQKVKGGETVMARRA